ncbi:MAG: hypothetical protein CL914_01385 [Deltaproteobacteria bacterium]|nr:hypothetical protein [Deltaproteobacteria bacterium]
MEESVLELMKEQKQAQESRILELQEKNINSNVNSLQIHPDYDLYRDHHYLYLNVNLPGVLEQELKVDLNQGEIIIQGEFPDLCTSEDVEFLERHRACGFFEKKFLLPPNLTLQKHEWQLVDGVLQIRMILEARKEPNLLLE